MKHTIGQLMVKFRSIGNSMVANIGRYVRGPVRAGAASLGAMAMNLTIGQTMVASTGRHDWEQGAMNTGPRANGS